MTDKESEFIMFSSKIQPPPARKVAPASPTSKPPTVNGVTLNKDGDTKVFDAPGIVNDILVSPVEGKPGTYRVFSHGNGPKIVKSLQGARDTVRTWKQEYNARQKSPELMLDDEKTFKPMKTLPLYAEPPELMLDDEKTFKPMKTLPLYRED